MMTGIVLTHNEEKNIARCLESLKFCDTLLVVDDNSTDKTVLLAKKLGATVISHPLDGDYAAQRNWALSQAKTSWVLFVDADEVVSVKLGEEIKSVVKKIESKGFFLPRIDYMCGEKLKHGDVGGVKLLRLARRGAGEWHGRVHETWNIEGSVATLKNPIYHHPHKNLADFLQRVNSYSSIKAREFYDQGRRTNILEIVLGPVARFINLYIFKLGFLDGTPGFIHAMTMSFYAYLVAGKLWLLYKGIK